MPLGWCNENHRSQVGAGMWTTRRASKNQLPRVLFVVQYIRTLTHTAG